MTKLERDALQFIIGGGLGFLLVALWLRGLAASPDERTQWTLFDMTDYWMEGGPSYAYPPLGYPVYQNGMRVYGGRGWSLWVLESGHVGPLVRR